MLRNRSAVVVGLLAGLAVACDDAADPTPAPSTARDATTSTPPDSGPAPIDAGPADTGAPVTCDPVTDTGCGAKSCFWIGGPIGTQCRDVAAPPKTHEQPCSTQLFNCEAGYYCVRLDGENDPHCRKLCRTGSNRDCAAVVGGNPDGYRCGVTLDRPSSLGVCSPDEPECLPHADTCDAMEYCEYTGGQLRCKPDGTPNVGDPCPLNTCRRGAICLSRGGDPLTCFTPCDPAAMPNPCPGGLACAAVVDRGRTLPFGVCE